MKDGLGILVAAFAWTVLGFMMVGLVLVMAALIKLTWGYLAS